MPRTRRGGAAASSAFASVLSKSISTEELREYFECPVCFQCPRPGSPIFACSQGHMLCNQCRSRINVCPICRISITEDNQMRLYFAERLLEEKVPAFCRHGCGQEFTGHLLFKHESEECPEQPMNCDYNHRGCKEKVVRSKKADHTLRCDYRQVDCPFEDCKEQVIQRQLMKHIKVGHLGLRHQQMQQVLICSLVLNVLFAILFFFLII